MLAPATVRAALAHQTRSVPLLLPPFPVFGSFVVGATPPAARVAVATGTLVDVATGAAVAVRVAEAVAVAVTVRVDGLAAGVRDGVGLAVRVAVAVAVGVATCACVWAGASAPMPNTAPMIPATPNEISAFLVRAIDCKMHPLLLGRSAHCRTPDHVRGET